ncbi:MAG TPA: hypothetical protein PLY32_06180 [Salinivirgaceae bacterium]|nr:hypothetical protein [Salinivirgaceae bacterium]HQA76692.1 hypothetical protein [Salinivirgaceae bacterium]
MDIYIVTIKERKAIGRILLNIMRRLRTVTVEKVDNKKFSSEVQQIAKDVNALREGTIDTRPLSELLNEI